MSVTANTTKKEKKAPKKRTQIIESHNNRDQDTKNPYLSSGSWRIVPISQGAISRLVNDLHEWIVTTDALSFNRFLVEHKIGKTCYYEWIKKWPELEEAHNHVRMSLGVKREEGALRKKLSESMVMFSMPMYDSEWKDTVGWRESIKKPKEDDDKRNITVIIPPFPGSDLVPDKKKDDEKE